MKALGKALAIVVLGAALAMGVMYVALPPNEMEGPADPYLSVRSPVLRFLRSIGVVGGGGFFWSPYLPSRSGSEICETNTDGEEILLYKMEIDSVPVYRGAFWKVGTRITYRTTQYVEPWSTRRIIRLCYAKDGERFLAGEGTIENGLVDPAGRRAEVRGFLPSGRDGFWIEEVDENGDVSTPHAWGDIGSFWRD